VAQEKYIERRKDCKPKEKWSVSLGKLQLTWSLEQIIGRLSELNISFKTSTVDCGKEFACYSSMEEQVDMSVYFADPYASCQRGTNEKANGLLREFFPKKTDLALITEEELELALHLINHRPRKCLRWKTSYEPFWEEVSQLD
jgi:IS30 family transposase